MATTDRAELHKTIWKIANDLRGSVDGWDFKQYVLGTLFYRFISENLTNYLNEHQHKAGIKDFDFSKLSDKDAEFGRKETVLEKGFFILPSELFVNVRADAKNDPNLNETLSRVFRNIEGSAVGSPSELDIKGLFDDLDVNSNKIGGTVTKRNELLVKLLDSVGELALGNYADNSIDAFGDAYEYLMTMYASSAGKSGGEFFTPQEVSELLAKITVVGKKKVNKVYDPACGSGSLLLQFAKVLGKDNVTDGFFGQEINITTYNLCRINMFLHDINYEKFDIAHGDTLTEPTHWDDQPFEAIVSNPPYSIKWDGDDNPLMINDPRFSPAGVLAPKGKADLAFTMHILDWLATNGTAAIVEFPGVMYRGGAEQKIRKYLVENNYVDAVIQLPRDLFFGTGIQTCILVLKKSKSTNDVIFINAENEFVRSGSKNKLRDEDIEKILEVFSKRKTEDSFSSVANINEIADKGFTLEVPAYVHNKSVQLKIDISRLNDSLHEIVAEQNRMRIEIESIVKDLGIHPMSDLEYTEFAIKDICDISRGTVISKDYLRDHPGDYPVYSSQTLNQGIFGYIDTYAYDFESLTWTTDGANAGSIFYHKDEKFTITNVCGLLRVKAPESISTRYLYYVLNLVAKRYVSAGMGNPKLMAGNMGEVKVMIPPIEAQLRIINVLDKFEFLINNNSAGLGAEIEARKKQYEYYKNELLSSGDVG
jgi:type I restriction enzyme M protein